MGRVFLNNLSPTKFKTMEPYDKLTRQLIPGTTDREKYENLKKIFLILESIANPRRGTWEKSATLQEFSDMISDIIGKKQDEP